MSSLIELNDFESNKLLNLVEAANTTQKLTNSNSSNLNSNNNNNHALTVAIQNESLNSNCNKLEKSKRHLSAAYSNKINFNYSPDLIKKTQVVHKANSLASRNSIIWSKLKTLNSNSNIDLNNNNINSSDKHVNESLNSKVNSINSLNTLNRNVSAANLNTSNVNANNNNNHHQFYHTNSITETKTLDSDRKTSYFYLHDDINQIRSEIMLNSANSRDGLFTASNCRCVYSLCCPLSLTEKNTLNNLSAAANANLNSNNNNNNNLTGVSRCHILSFYLKKLFGNFKLNLIGLSLSCVIGFSFVVMTYLLRHSLNLIELAKNTVTSNNNNNNNDNNDSLPNATFSFNIEIKRRNADISCDYCFFIVWTATSCLIFVYPVFFLVYCVFSRKKLISASSKTLILNKVESTSDSTETNASSSTSSAETKAKQAQVSPHVILFSESFKIFNSKKKHDSNNTSTNAPNTNTTTTTTTTTTLKPSFNIEHLKMKRYLFLKIAAVTFIWVLTGYSYIRAINLLYCSDVVILFSVNFAFVFIASWIVLHYKFIPIRVN